MLGLKRRHGWETGAALAVRRLSPARLASTGASVSASRPSPRREGKGRGLLASSSVAAAAAVWRP